MNSSKRPERFRFHLDFHSGVPAYRQIIDRVTGGIAAGALLLAISFRRFGYRGTGKGADNVRKCHI